MAKELDNKKMWASYRKELEKIDHKFHMKAIDKALADQGFEYKNGCIVPIGNEQEPFKIEAGKWYVCIKDMESVGGSKCYEKGKCYHSEEEGHITSKDGLNLLQEEVASEYFRPATEEEIKASGQIGGQNGGQKPKFKVGDFVVTSYGKVNQVVSVDKDGDGYYTLDDGVYFSGSWCDMYHIWTIQDAKDGDVLVCESGWTCIFKSLNDNTFSSYCFMDKDGWFCETGSECHTLKEEFIKAYNGKIHPATKEQRDLLFQKMHEAGYEWDAEKNKLNKIEQKAAGCEEDEDAIGMAIIALENMYDPDAPNKTYAGYTMPFNKAALRLRFLKDRVPSKIEWSEEDERNSIYICAALECYFRLREDRNNTNGSKELCEAKNWLYNKIKSLRPQSKWKPSEEQMYALEYFIAHNDGHTGYAKDLEELRKQIKALYKL